MVGANDVANSFSSVVGSGTLSIPQVVIIAAIFEFVGAVAMGGNVASTIRDDIVDPDKFQGEPALLMWALMCSSVTTATWLGIATYMELPVSTTQATVSALAGIGFALKGSDGVNWWCLPEEGKVICESIVPIVISWFAAPVFSAVAANVFYVPMRFLVLRSDSAYDRTFISFPIIVFIVITVLIAMIFNKGGDKLDEGVEQFDDGEKAGIAFGCGGAAGLIAALLMPRLRGHIDRITETTRQYTDFQFEKTPENEAKNDEEAVQEGTKEESKVEATRKTYTDVSTRETLIDALRFAGTERSVMQKIGYVARSFVNWVVDYKPAYVINSQEGVESGVTDLHLNREGYDPKAETTLSFLQILSAIFAAFSHGANDIANAVGPLSGAWTLYRKGSVSSEADQTKGILAYGAAALIIGLALYGTRCIAVLGTKLAALSPSRGLCVELGYALVIVFAASYSLPVSTTLTQTGAVIGIGLSDRAFKGVNWRAFFKIFSGWVINVIVSSLVGAAIASIGSRSPAALGIMDKQIDFLTDAKRSQIGAA